MNASTPPPPPTPHPLDLAIKQLLDDAERCEYSVLQDVGPTFYDYLQLEKAMSLRRAAIWLKRERHAQVLRAKGAKTEV